MNLKEAEAEIDRLNQIRASLVEKMQRLEAENLKAENLKYLIHIREAIIAADRELLAAEVDRLKAKRYSFKGQTIEDQLGVDSWVLRAAPIQRHGGER